MNCRLMIRKLFLILFLNLVVFFGLLSAAAAQQIAPASFLDPQAAEKANAHEDELYSSAKDALDNGEYDNALKQFDEVIKIHGRKADGAMYWKAYALNKAGNKAQALTVIADLRKSYPKSNWLRDAAALEQEMRGATVNPENISDEELKLLALQSLMNSDPEKAVPLLEKILQSNNSPKIKDRALFVLSQSGSDKAQQILLAVAKNNAQPDLQRRAIRYLGMNGGRNGAVLKEIYNSSANAGVKKSVFQAWLMCGCKEEVLVAAQTEKDPGLRREAIRYLGMMGGRAELKRLYQQNMDLESKEELIKAMGLGGDVEGLTQIAKTEQDPVVRREAIKDLGLFGGHPASDILVEIYGPESNLETKKAVINALFLNSAGKQMVFLARKETNPELKRELIQKMSLMSSPEISDYMMEILNK
jgi:HEAT repeat protein